MAYDLEEQEQLATLKAWWKQYGNLTTWFVIALLLAFSGWSGWKYYQRSQAMKGALLYEEIVKAIEAKDTTKVERAAADIKDKFSGTSYAQMAALAAAKSAFDAKDLKATKAHLDWVINNFGGRFNELATGFFGCDIAVDWQVAPRAAITAPPKKGRRGA